MNIVYHVFHTVLKAPSISSGEMSRPIFLM